MFKIKVTIYANKIKFPHHWNVPESCLLRSEVASVQQFIAGTLYNRHNQNGNAWAIQGQKKKQPLEDYVHSLKGYYCTWSGLMRERNINTKSLHCMMSAVVKTFWPQLPQDVCLYNPSENSRPNSEVLLLSKMLRGQWKLSLTVSLFWDGNVLRLKHCLNEAKMTPLI